MTQDTGFLIDPQNIYQQLDILPDEQEGRYISYCDHLFLSSLRDTLLGFDITNVNLSASIKNTRKDIIGITKIPQPSEFDIHDLNNMKRHINNGDIPKDLYKYVTSFNKPTVDVHFALILPIRFIIIRIY